MNTIINDIFEAQAEKENFKELDKEISKESSRHLKAYEQTLSPIDYEKVRDAAFSAAFIAKKEAFRIGFKTAMSLMLECRDSK